MKQFSDTAMLTSSLKREILSIITTYAKKEWLSLKEAAIYAGVSYNTLIKLRSQGLKVCEIEGIKRVSKKEIDRFLEENSF